MRIRAVDQAKLEQAKRHLQSWLDADYALATSKSYTIDGRMITRANAQEIRERIAYWGNEVERLERARNSVNKTFSVIPRDR